MGDYIEYVRSVDDVDRKTSMFYFIQCCEFKAFTLIYLI